MATATPMIRSMARMVSWSAELATHEIEAFVSPLCAVLTAKKQEEEMASVTGQIVRVYALGSLAGT